MGHPHLYQKYFIDSQVYNCPFCSRRGVTYSVKNVSKFNWQPDKLCYAYIVQCNSCHDQSLHLSFVDIPLERIANNKYRFRVEDDDLDALFFYSIPDSSLALDKNIPQKFRQLISEAESCLKQGLRTGASVYLRKLAYEIAASQEVYGDTYKKCISLLKEQMSTIDPSYFDAILTIISASEDHVNEKSYDAWSANQIRQMLSSFLAILNEYYVIPTMEENRIKDIQSFRKEVHEILFSSGDQ